MTIPVDTDITKLDPVRVASHLLQIRYHTMVVRCVGTCFARIRNKGNAGDVGKLSDR